MIRKIFGAWLALRCCWILAWRSLVILLRLQGGGDKRQLVNRFAQRGAVKMLHVVRADYTISWEHSIDWRAQENYILMCNHQSLMDLPLIFATVPTTVRVIAKQELFKIPVFGNALAASDCVAVDRENPTNSADIFVKVKNKLNAGVAFLVFPEGMRSRTGELLPFKLGAFRLARETGAKIIPVGISGTGQVLVPNSRLINVRRKVKICFGKPIDASQYATIEEQKKLLQDVRIAIAQLCT